MTNVVFSFDAQVAGVIAGVDAMMGAFSKLENAAQSLVSSFASIASQWATTSVGLGSLIQNFGALSGVMGDGSDAMGAASGSASNLAYQLQQLSERAADAARAHQEMVDQIRQQEADLTENYKEEVAQRTETEQESLQKLVENHAYAMQQIQQQEADLTSSYEDQINKRLLALQDPRAMQHQQMVTALEQQIDALISTGHANQAKSLETQLDTENASYQKYIQNTIEPYYQYLDQQGYTHHQQALQRLKDRLAKEQQQYDQQLAYLKKHYAEEMSTLERHYQQEEQRLREHLDKEDQAYAQQVQRINEERSHLLSTGGGGAGGAVPYGAPTPDKIIQLFKRLGINTGTPQGALEGTNALQAWLTGGTFGGVDFGVGYAPNSQMNVQQLWGVITQAMAYGQDPTKNLGGGNLLDVVSNLMGMAELINGKGPGAAFNSILSIFEKAESGNTIGLERQLAALGISPELLAKYGVKFGGRGGKTIENPAAVLGALEQIGLSPGMRGMGHNLSELTPQGAMTRFRDFWSGVVQQIMGNAMDPHSLMSQFMVQVNRLYGFLTSHQGQIISFGKTVVEWLIGKFQAFLTWTQGSQAHHILHQIAHAFHEIGDALHWLGQHQHVLHLLLALLGAQVGGKMLGFLGGGILGVGGGLLAGGPLGIIGNLLQGPMHAGGNIFWNLALKHFGAITPGALAGPLLGGAYGAYKGGLGAIGHGAGGLFGALWHLFGPMGPGAPGPAGPGGPWTPPFLWGSPYGGGPAGAPPPPFFPGAPTAPVPTAFLPPWLGKTVAKPGMFPYLTAPVPGSGATLIGGLFGRGMPAPEGDAAAWAQTMIGFGGGGALTRPALGIDQPTTPLGRLWRMLSPYASEAGTPPPIPGGFEDTVIARMPFMSDMPPTGKPSPTLLRRLADTIVARFRPPSDEELGQEVTSLMGDPTQLRKNWITRIFSPYGRGPIGSPPAPSGFEDTLLHDAGKTALRDADKTLLRDAGKTLLRDAGGTLLSGAESELTQLAGAPTSKWSGFWTMIRGGITRMRGGSPDETLLHNADPTLLRGAGALFGGGSPNGVTMPLGGGIFNWATRILGGGGSPYGGGPIGAPPPPPGGGPGGIMGMLAGLFGGGGAAGGGVGPLGILMGLLRGGALSAITGLGPALAGIAMSAGPILLLVGAIGGLMLILVQNKDKILPFLHMLADFFGHKLKEAVGAVTHFAHEVQSRLGAAFGPGSLIYGFLNTFAKLWAAMWPGISLIFKGVWNVIEGVIRFAWSLISGIILIGLDILGGKWGLAWHDLGKLLKGAWDGILHILKGLVQILGGIILGFFGGLWYLISGPLLSLLGNLLKFFLWTLPTGILHALLTLEFNMIMAVVHLVQGVGKAFHALWGIISGDTKKAALDAGMHADEMKLHQITAAQQSAEGVVRHYQLQKDGLLRELAETKDPAKRHAIEMKIAQIDAAEATAKGTIAKAQEQKEKVLAHLKELAAQAKHHADLMKMGVIGHVIEMVEDFEKWVGGLWGKLTGKLGQLKDNFVKWVLNLKDEFLSKLGLLGEGIGNFFSKTIPDKLHDLWNAILKTIKSLIDNLINTVLPGPLQGPVHSALGFAEGGYYPGRAISIVGERGPELFFSEHPGAVVSNKQIRDALLGGGAVRSGAMRPILINTVHVHGVQNPDQFYKKLNYKAGRYAEHGVRGGTT